MEFDAESVHEIGQKQPIIAIFVGTLHYTRDRGMQPSLSVVGI
jgi:hypothetical protein